MTYKDSPPEGPWSYSLDTRNDSAGVDYYVNTLGIMGKYTSIFDMGGRTSEATAKFIVTACNSHRDLLEALKEAKHELEAWASVAMPIDEEETRETLIKIDAAIKRAEG